MIMPVTNFFQKKRKKHSRPEKNLKEQLRILIVCEGAKTEPNYFKAFRTEGPLSALEVIGLGKNTLSLVKDAVDRKKQAKVDKEDFDEVWCVFDRNSFDQENVNLAFDTANKNQIKIAFSNEAFELWYLLHFSYYDSSLSRNQYQDKLTELLKFKYEKNMKDIYFHLINLQINAINNAKKLLGKYYNEPNPINHPEVETRTLTSVLNHNPCTTVHELVEVLNDELKKTRFT
ncbi:MAG: RloB domain-containing protein [Deltaproteobacteria bacterium]|nr:RloB domain-containing protein [Deltaproteobacteria bacterium]